MKNNSCKSDNDDSAALSWLSTLEQLAAITRVSPESRMRTMISCVNYQGKRSFYVPPDMNQLQPRSLRYLHSFARQHQLQLVEDRRRVAVQPLRENRLRSESVFAPAIGDLLKKMGMPGEARTQSYPHRLAKDSPHIPMHRLIRMAAFASSMAKKVEVPTNIALSRLLREPHGTPINAYACKVNTASTQTILSVFESPAFRAIGYSAGTQYVVHLCVAGGSVKESAIWTNDHTLTLTDFQFQLFQGAAADSDLGLFHTTFYLDLDGADAPWWLGGWASTSPVLHSNDEPPMVLQQTGT